MNLDEEMLLWEQRNTDDFGCMMNKLQETLKDSLLEEENDLGFRETWLSSITTRYVINVNDSPQAYLWDTFYNLVNYDYISINDDCTINVSNSNHPDAAQLIADYLAAHPLYQMPDYLRDKLNQLLKVFR